MPGGGAQLCQAPGARCQARCPSDAGSAQVGMPVPPARRPGRMKPGQCQARPVKANGRKPAGRVPGMAVTGPAAGMPGRPNECKTKCSPEAISENGR